MKYIYGLVALIVYSSFSYGSEPAKKQGAFNCWANYSFSGYFNFNTVACSEAQEAAQKIDRESKGREKFAVFQLCYMRNKQPVCEMSQKEVSCARAAELLQQAMENTKRYSN